MNPVDCNDKKENDVFWVTFHPPETVTNAGPPPPSIVGSSKTCFNSFMGCSHYNHYNHDKPCLWWLQETQAVRWDRLSPFRWLGEDWGSDTCVHHGFDNVDDEDGVHDDENGNSNDISKLPQHCVVGWSLFQGDVLQHLKYDWLEMSSLEIAQTSSSPSSSS